MVGTDNEPMIEITNADNAAAWFAENTDEFIVILLLGIVIGFVLSYAFRKFVKFFFSEDEENNDKNNDKE